MLAGLHPKTQMHSELLDKGTVFTLFDTPGEDISQTAVDFHRDLIVRQKLPICIPAGLHALWQQVHGRAVYNLHKGKPPWADTCTQSKPL